MKTVEETLTELCDREAIRELPLRYCDCVWRGDVAGIVDLFTDDGVFTIKGHEREVVHKGREALLKMYSDGLTNLTPRPYIHNHVVELGFYGRATGRCYVELRNASRNMEWAGTGYYHDEYVKVGESWKFASRYFTAVQLALAQPAASRARVAAKPPAAKRATKPAARKAPAKASARAKPSSPKRKARP
ncbi:MAG TPA: nuclear transport factor 2 family protein [Candidatus Binataceae bacterium]|jgi:ketosteroid isomerase-like protein|nr:nuclear transport factor 2 family protein [Candidatus Binataceae bacterium]